MLKQFELLPRSIRRHGLLAVKQFDGTKLLVGNAEDADVSECRKERFYPFYMDLGVLHACAMTHVNGELEHREAVALEVLTEQGIGLLVFPGSRRQVEENKYPHNPVFAKTVLHDVTDKNQLLITPDRLCGAFRP